MTTFEYPFFNNSLKMTYTPEGLVQVLWQRKSVKVPNKLNSQEKQIARVLKSFLEGKSDSRELPIDWKHLEGTDFQKQVWKKMYQIPFGQTQSYGDIAKAIKNPGATRAIGSACGKNPVMLAIPCHRVVSSNGLGGFSGGGLSVKKKLLLIEGHSQYV